MDLQAKNSEIDSLKSKIIKGASFDWRQLKKEIFIQYPQLDNLSFGKSINISPNQIDTIPTHSYMEGRNKSIQLKKLA